MNGYNFTERVRRILVGARDEAHRLHHEYVGTEHLLLALIRQDGGVAAAVLANLNVDLGEICKVTEETVHTGKRSSVDPIDLPYTSRAKKVIELSLAAARDLKHNYVGGEHLLLGLIREEKGIAAQILTHHGGLTFEAARDEVLRLLTPDALATDMSIRPGIVGVSVKIRLADGSELREEFHSIFEAMSFLNRQ